MQMYAFFIFCLNAEAFKMKLFKICINFAHNILYKAGIIIGLFGHMLFILAFENRIKGSRGRFFY